MFQFRRFPQPGIWWDNSTLPNRELSWPSNILKKGHTWQNYYVRVFSVFRALYVLNGYVHSVQMERAINSDSKTPVKKYDRTSGTDLS